VLKGRAMEAWKEVSMYSQGPGFRLVSPCLNIGRESRVGQREVAIAPHFFPPAPEDGKSELHERQRESGTRNTSVCAKRVAGNA
jgi:hypothetical protein